MNQRIKPIYIVLAVTAAAFIGWQTAGLAKDAGGKVATPAKVSRASASAKKGAAQQAVPAGVTVNACGCYRSEAGLCFCGDKNATCQCPGDCEPMACEQKRAKEIQREVAAETKKAQDEEKRRLDEAAAAAEAAAKSRAEPGPVSSGDSVIDEAADDTTSDKKADEGHGNMAPWKSLQGCPPPSRIPAGGSTSSRRRFPSG